MSGPHILVISPFEAELQPLAAAFAAGALREAGALVTGWDVTVSPPPTMANLDMILLSVQQFESLERAFSIARQVRAGQLFGTAGVPVVAFGQYAQMNHSTFLQWVDAVLMDEPERVANELVAAARGERAVSSVPAVISKQGITPKPAGRRISTRHAARDIFPPLANYEAHHTPYGLMGNIEASRGCHHKCTYCSVYGAYDGGVAAYEVDVVVTDALELAEQGVRHFCFIDAEFFNSRTIGRKVIERLRDELGPVTFEFTTRVDHVLSYGAELKHLVELGLTRITCALEFPSDRILRIFDKHISVDSIREAVVTAGRIGFELNPTFIPFTPWVDYDELLTFEDFLVETGLAKVTHPTALQTRLLLFKGSPLLKSPWMDGIQTVDRGHWVEWRHPDARVEELWQARRDEAQDAGAVRCCVKC